MGPSISECGGGASAPSSYPFTFNRTQRTVFFAALTNNGERDNFFGAIITTWPVSETLSVTNLDVNGGDAKIDLVIQGGTDNYDHTVSVTLNGFDVPVPDDV